MNVIDSYSVGGLVCTSDFLLKYLEVDLLDLGTTCVSDVPVDVQVRVDTVLEIVRRLCAIIRAQVLSDSGFKCRS